MINYELAYRLKAFQFDNLQILLYPYRVIRVHFIKLFPPNLCGIFFGSACCAEQNTEVEA